MLHKRGITVVIPQKSDQIAARKRRGRKGGRPPGLDVEACKGRNVAERSFALAKQWRPWPPDTTSSPSPTAPPSSCPRASPGPAYRRAGQQHELPAYVTVLADAVRLRDLGEREGLRDREREAPGLDQLADPGERVDRAAGVPAAERHPVLLRATEVGDRHDVLRAARLDGDTVDVGVRRAHAPDMREG